MCRLVNLRPAIGIPASTGKHHALVMKADIIDQPKPIVGYRLLKRPKKSSADVISKAQSFMGYFSYLPSGGLGSSSAIQSVSFIFGTRSLKASFWIQGFP